VTEDYVEVVDLLPNTKERWPSLIERADEASTNIAGTKKLIFRWRRDLLPMSLPISEHHRSLSARLMWFAILICERSFDLCCGVVEALEGQRPFSAASTARAEVEIVGQAVGLEKEITGLLSQPEPDVRQLDRVTRQALFSTPRSLGGPGAGGFPDAVGRLVAAGQREFGDHFEDDYGFLSALAHPVALVVWTGDTDSLPTSTVTEALAELFVKIVADGAAAVARSALELMDHAQQSDVTLPEGRIPSEDQLPRPDQSVT
jgi:hypothetical protein